MVERRLLSKLFPLFLVVGGLAGGYVTDRIQGVARDKPPFMEKLMENYKEEWIES